MATHPVQRSDDKEEVVDAETGEAPAVEPLPGWELRTIPLVSIRLPEDTPAFLVDAKRLAVSIKTVGILEPPAVEPDGQDLFGNPLYRAIYGRRRLRALEVLEWTHVRALVYQQELSEEQVILAASHENFNRSDDFGALVWRLYELLHTVGVSESELTHKLMINKNTLDKYMKLVRMPRFLVECIRDGSMSKTVANEAARLPRKQQSELAKRVDALLEACEDEEREKFKVSKELVMSLRTQIATPEVSALLTKPLIPEGLLESMEGEEEILYAPGGLPTPAEMKHYLRAYSAALPGKEGIFDAVITVLDQVYVAEEKGESDAN